MGTSASMSSDARDRRLDALVDALEARGDRIELVRIVEAWSREGAPSAKARLASGRAFHGLRLMDRAMARAKEALEADASDAAALRLLAEVFLDRGWPVKARKPLGTLRGSGEDVADLWERAHRDPERPEATARQVERDGDPARLLKLAEAFMATGSFLRATGILERLRRLDPEHARVRELLWGLAGDFGGPPVDAQLAAAKPGRPAPDAVPDEPENTESVVVGDSLHGGGDRSFPALFKYASQDATDGGDGAEATVASGLASPAQMAEAPHNARDADVESPLSEPGGGDTQIRLVLQPGEDPPRVAHRRRDGAANGLDLRDWQRSMGMTSPADSDLASGPDEDVLEEEDANLVVMTRAEASPASAPEPPATFARPIEVIDRFVPPPPAPPPAPEPTTSEVPPPPPRPFSLLRSPVVLAGVALAIAVLLVGGALFVLGAMRAHTNASTARDDLLHALGRQDYATLLQQEARLEQRVRAGEPQADVVDALTDARLVLWSDFNGDPARLEAAETTLADGPTTGSHRHAILRAQAALARQDLPGASAAIAREQPADDEERLLFARIASQSGDLALAMKHFEAIDRNAEPRYRLARAQVLADAGRPDDALVEVRAALKAWPDHIGARILELELREGEPANVAASADLLLGSLADEQLAPRLEGRAQAVRARALAALGAHQKSTEAVAAGLARDGTNPDLLYLDAAARCAAAHLVDALVSLEVVARTRQGSARVQAARVLVLLELDRVEEAGAIVTDLEARRIAPDLTGTLAALVAVWGRGEAPPAPFVASGVLTALQAYATALALHQQSDPGASPAIDAAGAALGASDDPFERRLAPRLLALAVLAGSATDAEARVAAAEAGAGDDAVGHVWLGRYYEDVGRRALAAQHFDRSAVLAPQLGMAWYEKGRFYSDARDRRGRAGQAWRSYLALAPTGPRADRVRDTLGLR